MVKITTKKKRHSQLQWQVAVAEVIYEEDEDDSSSGAGAARKYQDSDAAVSVRLPSSAPTLPCDETQKSLGLNDTDNSWDYVDGRQTPYDMLKGFEWT